MIRNIFFDIDDTLLDFKRAESVALKKALGDFGISLDDETVRKYSRINSLQWEKLERGELTREEVLVSRFEIFFSELGIDASAYEAQAKYEYLLGVGHYFIDGAPELLESLYGKYRLYIASNGTKSVQDRRIASAGIARYFDGIFVSQCIGADKPQREFFNRCFARIEDFKSDEAIIIGDRLSSDILGGINAGIKTCWFNPNDEPPREDIVPDYEIKKLSELPELLEVISNELQKI